MATLKRLDKNETITDATEIQNFLKGFGIEYAKWEAKVPLTDDDTQETILKAYEHEINPVMEKKGFKTADVISVNPKTPNIEDIRKKFLSEHTHTEDEVRFFVDGAGTFYFNLEEEVVSIHCVKGDFLSVPDQFKHWFDMAPEYTVKCIRLFTNEEGWVAHYTDSGLDKNYVD